MLSLSANGNLLSQWRAYGGSSGVALGLSRERFAALIRYNEYEDDVVKYDVEEQLGILMPIVSNLFDILAMPDDVHPSKYDRLSVIPEQYCRAFPYLKHVAFSEEAEHRVVARQGSVSVRSSGDKLVPYRKLSIPEGTIFSLIIGPNRNPERLFSAVLDLFESSRFKYEHVMVGNVPFEGR